MSEAVGVAPDRTPRAGVIAKRHFPASTPRHPEAFRLLDVLETMEDFLWGTYLAQPLTDESFLGALAFAMVVSNGVIRPDLGALLAKVRWLDVSPDRALWLPLDSRDRSDRRCRLPLASGCWLILAQFLRRPMPSSATAPLFLPEVIGDKERAKGLNDCIARGYERFAREARGAIGRPVPRLGQLHEIGTYFCFTRGLEPIFLDVFRRGNVLPTSLRHDAPYTLERGPLRVARFAPKNKGPRNIEGSRFAEEARAILFELKEALLQKAIATGPCVSSRRQDFLLSADEARQKAEVAFGERSVVVLAIAFVRHLIASGDASVASIFNYVGEVFLEGLFLDPEVSSFAHWDDDQHLAALAKSMKRPRLRNASARQQVAMSWQRVYRLGAAMEPPMCPLLVFDKSNAGVCGTPRAHLIGLGEMDQFLRDLTDSGDREDLLDAAAYVLGFYGCARTEEAHKVTLRDVVLGGEDTTVYLWGTKTDSAERSVPIGLLASTAALESLGLAVEARRKEFAVGTPLYQIPLFGPSRVSASYQYGGWSSRLITRLKHRFGPDYVYHSLRHSGVSWLLVRWYCVREPDFAGALHERYHELLARPALARLARLFLHSEQHGPKAAYQDMIHLAKVVGHRGWRPYLRCRLRACYRAS